MKFPLEFIPLNKESVVFLKSFKFFNDIENLESVDIDFSDNFDETPLKVESYDETMKQRAEELKKICQVIFNTKNIHICYDGKINYNTQIRQLINKF